DTRIDFYNDEAAQKVMPGRLLTAEKQGKDDGKARGAVWDFEEESIYQHPFMKPFRNWKDYNVVKFPSQTFAYWSVEPNEKEGVVIVSYSDRGKKDKAKKTPAMLERRLPAAKGKPGKILLFTTPLAERSPRWNDYLESTNATYVVLLGLATNYLAGQTEAPK